MEVGNLIKVVSNPDVSQGIVEGELLYITEISNTGLNVIVVSGSNFGMEFFLPLHNRKIEVISGIG